jgi:uncharacterized protein
MKSLLSVLAVLALPAGAMADDEALYRSTVVVTGDREETRVPAIPLGFELAGEKLTGNPDIAEDPGFSDIAAKASGMIWSYTYHDRLFGKPIHDEQGTRDRPFNLTFQFEKTRMDAAMAKLGEKPWLGPRPTLCIVMEVTDMARTYLLAADSAHGVDQRASFADASAHFAIPIVFAKESDLAAAGITVMSIDSVPPDELQALQQQAYADAILLGHLDWDAKAMGWHATWSMPLKSGAEKWETNGVNFDAAFRDAVGGAAKRMRPQ